LYAALENETDNGTVELKTTAGSAANLRLLTGEYLQLAIAQGDLAQDAYDQTGIFADEEETRGFGAVAALYTEACQIVVRADADIQSVEDLQGKTVSIGAEESGSEQNALQILAAYGLNDKLVDTVNLNYEDAAAQLKAGKVDAIFITAGAPSPVLTELAGECGIRLLNVDGAPASDERLQRLQCGHAAGRYVSRPGHGCADRGRESRSAGQRRAARKAGAEIDRAAVLRPGRYGRTAWHSAGRGTGRCRGRWHPVPRGCGRLL
jgi:TRAP-type uncharacterized transport system substrate-binding protein